MVLRPRQGSLRGLRQGRGGRQDTARQWPALARQGQPAARVSSGSALGSVDRRRHPKAIGTATYYRRVIRSIWKNQRDMYPAGGPKMLKDVWEYPISNIRSCSVISPTLKSCDGPCYLVVRLIAISQAYRSGDPDKGHRVGLGD